MEPTLQEKELGEKITEAIRAARKAAGGSLHWPELTATVVKVLVASRPAPAAPAAPKVTPEMIYQAYPRRVAGKLALKKIIQAAHELKAKPVAVADPTGFTYLLERTEAFAGAVKRWPLEEQKRFCPHPATWFGQGRYLDDPATWERDNGTKARAVPNYSKI